MLTKREIKDFLTSQGITKNHTVVIHISMRAVGEVEDGCDGIIDAVKDYLSDGLLVIPTHTWANVDQNNPVFDVTSTMPCIGALPTVAARRKDGARSLHPTHSVVAFGKSAQEFTMGEQYSTSPAPVGGLWSRLYDVGAKILLIGVGLNRNTFIHAVDEMLDLPDRLEEPIPLTVIDKDGTRYQTQFRKHGFTGSENFGKFKPALDYHGALSYGTLGNAEVTVFDTKIGTEVIKQLWSKAEFDLCKEDKEIPKSYYENLTL